MPNGKDGINIFGLQRVKNLKMLKWMKVRQSASATTPKLLPSTSALSVSHQGTKDDGTKVEAEIKIKEEEEDSGMEREDSVSNIELNDLKKVCLRLIIRFVNLHCF